MRLPPLRSLLGALVAVSLLCTANDAASRPPPTGNGMDQVVFASALAALRDRHIEPAVPAQRMTAGLKGLAVAEPSLAVALSADRIEIAVGAATRSILPAPPPGDAEAWGRTGAAAVEAAASASPRLRALEPQRRRALVLDEMASGLDPYTRFVPAAEAAAQRAARFGIGSAGLTLTPDAAGARVTALEPEGPAWRAGLALGDRVTVIDGALTRGLGTADLEAALAGEAGMSVSLTFVRRGERPRHVLVVRASRLPETARLDWTDGVPVVAVTGFSRETEQVVARIVAGLSARQPPPSGLMLDLRGNRGGLLQQAVGVSDVFLSEGEVVIARGRHPDASRTYLAGGADLASGMVIVVLVDGGTASAAEAVAAALHDRGRARVVGAATQGKGLIQFVHALPDGSELHVSWSRLLGPAGEALQGRGVLPDLCTSRGEAIARKQAARLIGTITAPGEDGEAVPEQAGREPASITAERMTCPPMRGGPLDMEAGLWLLRRSLSDAPAPGGDVVR